MRLFHLSGWVETGERLQLPSGIRSIKLVRPLLQYNIDLLLAVGGGDTDTLATICEGILSNRNGAIGLVKRNTRMKMSNDGIMTTVCVN